MRAPAYNPHASTCPTCGRQYSSATTGAVCPKDAAVRREQERAEKAVGIETTKKEAT